MTPTPQFSAVPERPGTPATHACGRCSARWTGLRTCHCNTCHRTFTGVTPFDRHRRGDRCLHPVDADLVDAGRTYACWGTRTTDTTEENP